MTETAKEYLELHKINSEELRHTSTVIWQFAVAIVTLQGGALALAAQSGFHTLLGRCVLGTGFLLAIAFSMMLVRQATERRGFVARVRAIEKELQKLYPSLFVPIPSCLRWFTSAVFAQFLLFESAIGLIVLLLYAIL